MGAFEDLHRSRITGSRAAFTSAFAITPSKSGLGVEGFRVLDVTKGGTNSS